MTIAEAIAKLQQFPMDHFIHCQLVDGKGNAWHMGFDFLPAHSSCTRLVVLNVTHPDLKLLPTAVLREALNDAEQSKVNAS